MILVGKMSNMMFGFVVITPLDRLLARFHFVVLLFNIWCVEGLTLGLVLEPLVGVVRSPPLVTLGELLVSGIDAPSFGSRMFLLKVF